MSVVINSYQSGRPSKVDVATVIEHLPMFLKHSLTSTVRARFSDRLVCHAATSEWQQKCEPEPSAEVADAFAAFFRGSHLMNSPRQTSIPVVESVMAEC
jgi:hypothetical protein